MTTNFHDPIQNGDSRKNDASIWNDVFSQLDTELTQHQNEIVAARGGYQSLDTKLDSLVTADSVLDDRIDDLIIDAGTSDAETIAARTVINYGTAPATLGDALEIVANNAFYVDAYGATGDGVTNDYTAIAAAITALGAGETLVFTPGKTYICNSALTLATANVKVIGYGATLNTSAYNGVALTINAAGVSVLGLTFVGEATTGSIEVPVSKNSLAITSGSDHLRVQDCRFEGYFRGGVRSQGNYVQIRGNTFVGVRHFDVDHYGCIHLSSTVEHAVVSGNTLTEVFDAGISLYNGVKYSVISNNTIYHTTEAGGAGSMGIYANIATVGCTISNNTIRGAVNEGIMLGNAFANTESYGNTITGNTIIDCYYTGITINAASGTSGNLSKNHDNTITGNTIIAVTPTGGAPLDYGILMDAQSTYDEVTDNVVSGNVIYCTKDSGTARITYGFRCNGGGSKRMVVSGNLINGVGTAVYMTGFQITATGNIVYNVDTGFYYAFAAYGLTVGNQVISSATHSLNYGASNTFPAAYHNYLDRLPTSAPTNWGENYIKDLSWSGSGTLSSGTVTLTSAAFSTTAGTATVVLERTGISGTAGALYVSGINQGANQITVSSTSGSDNGTFLWRLIR